MNDFNRELAEDLSALEAQGLRRCLRRLDSPQSTHICLEGRNLLNFSSNDYLGLANHPSLKDAASQALAKYGAGSGASRLISGSLPPHAQLEEGLAGFKGTEAALSFCSGYAAALGAICALVGKDDVIVLDRLVHACIVDAARLSGAKIRVFAHNDLNYLEKILAWAGSRSAAVQSLALARRSRTLVVTESVFSMDGDRAPLREIVELKDRHGAWLMVDEAHATGLYGRLRRGLAEEQDVSDRIEVQMGTLGKALGAAGGFICGSRTLVEFLVNRARSFIFSTAPVPAAAVAAAAAIRLVQAPEGEERRALLWRRVGQLRAGLGAAALGWSDSKPSAIIPLILGEESNALRAAACLLERGLFVPAIRYPTVARGRARLRLTVTADHTSEDVEQLLNALRGLSQERGLSPQEHRTASDVKPSG